MKPSTSRRCINVIAKPIGAVCNLDCAYCFYSEKLSMYDSKSNSRISDEVLETFIIKYIGYQPSEEVEFIWQGGEPTLMGLNFFRKVVLLQKIHSSGKIIKNSLQTNGTMLDELWCSFLAENKFLVGLSLDGPEYIHNYYRYSVNRDPSFDKVIRSLKLLQKHGVEFNILACVTDVSSKKPLEIYHFFKSHGVRFIQFIPIIERTASKVDQSKGLNLARPLLQKESAVDSSLTPWSVEPLDYGNFLNAIFDEWIKNDIGKTFVMNFEWALAAWLGAPSSSVCVFGKTCGRCVVLEHNGDIYSCDHYVYPEYRLGNIMREDLSEIIDKPKQSEFGEAKEIFLPIMCKECKVLPACRGGCPKHRFLSCWDINGNSLNYLCEGYKTFFCHINKYMNLMVRCIQNDIPLSTVMEAANSVVWINNKE